MRLFSNYDLSQQYYISFNNENCSYHEESFEKKSLRRWKVFLVHSIFSENVVTVHTSFTSQQHYTTKYILQRLDSQTDVLCRLCYYFFLMFCFLTQLRVKIKSSGSIWTWQYDLRTNEIQEISTGVYCWELVITSICANNEFWGPEKRIADRR